ncbi:hypothetical protein ACIBBE_45255 [Streptomyces sp. NPDC051644]|uniref:hypothetical protein n=1 Tax=Streptomyces sp. NPDC051644 TaxID=3365666 RepID=UPI0037902E01
MQLPYVYRVTKYDPADRDEHGYYTGSEETVSDHGEVEASYLQAVGPVGSRRTSRTSVYEAPRKITTPATSQRTDAPERYSRTAKTSSITLARTPKAEIRALMRLVTRTSSTTTSASGSDPNEPA